MEESFFGGGEGFGFTSTPTFDLNVSPYQIDAEETATVSVWLDAAQLVSGYEVRPMLYTFQMYHQFGDEQVLADSGVEDVTVYAAKRADGALTVMVVNLSDDEQQVALDVAGMTAAEAEIWLLDKDHNAENLGTQPLPADGTVTLPAQSVTLYVIL